MAGNNPNQFPQQFHAQGSQFAPQMPGNFAYSAQPQFAASQNQFHPPSPIAVMPQGPSQTVAAAQSAPPAFFNPWEPPPPFTSAPQDPELQKRIEKYLEYVVRIGPQFEALLKEKQKDNPEYAFLLGGEGFHYYRYKLWMSINPQSSAGYQAQQPAFNQFPSQDHQVQNPPVQAPTQFFPPFPAQAPLAPPNIPPQFLPTAAPAFPVSSQSQIASELPPILQSELSNVLESLTGTKEGIKSAKSWFMQRAEYAHLLAHSFLSRVQYLSPDPERQLHVVFLINDILFNSFQQRQHVSQLDGVAAALLPVLGHILHCVYSAAAADDATREKLHKVVQFWGAKGVFSADLIQQLERDMTAPPPSHSLPPVAPPPARLEPLAAAPPKPEIAPASKWGPPVTPSLSQSLPAVSAPPSATPSTSAQAKAAAVAIAAAAVAAAASSSAAAAAANAASSSSSGFQDEAPPYPLFPPGLIPAMVRKMQIGSGVPYSPISPADIPSQVPSQTAPESHIQRRLRKFLRSIGQAGPTEGDELSDEGEGEDGASLRSLAGRPAQSPFAPAADMEVDPETGMMPDGSVASHGGLGARAGLGAQGDDTQYDDVYLSYRKSRSSNYHVGMSSRAALKYEHA